MVSPNVVLVQTRGAANGPILLSYCEIHFMYKIIFSRIDLISLTWTLEHVILNWLGSPHRGGAREILANEK